MSSRPTTWPWPRRWTAGPDFLRRQGHPAPRVLARLAAFGSSVDVASPAEVGGRLAAGAEPARISYGNTIKKEADIARRAMGVRMFTFDSEAELAKIAAPLPVPRSSAAS